MVLDLGRTPIFKGGVWEGLSYMFELFTFDFKNQFFKKFKLVNF